MPKILSKEIVNETIKALRICKGNVSEAAKSLGINRSTYRTRLSAIKSPDFNKSQKTKEEIIESSVKALRRCNGNIAEAAKSLGISRSTFRTRLEMAKNYNNKIDLTKSAKPNAEERIKVLEKIVEEQRSALEMERSIKVSALHLDLNKKMPRAGGDFIRVTIPDIHGAMHDRNAFAACINDVKKLDPEEVVIMGDWVDCGGFLAEHYTLGYVEECNYSYFKDDIPIANACLDALQKAAPRARIHYIEGNHETRVNSWCVTSALRNQSDADGLRNAVHPKYLLRLKERGIEYYSSGEYHQGLRTAGIIKLGACFFAHGLGCSKHAAADAVARVGGPVVFGHIHRIQSYGSSTVAHGEQCAWSDGCLCQFRRRYNHTQPHDWQHGYGVQMVRRDTGTFQHSTIHIIDGRSFLYLNVEKH